MTRRSRWGLVGGAVALVLVGAWLAVGLVPRIGVGAFAQLDLESVDAEDTWPDEVPMSMVVDPSDSTYDGMWTFQNEGVLPVTVRLAEHEKPSDLHWEALLHPYDERHNVVGKASDTVMLAAGGGLAVTFSWGPGCAPVAAGTTMSTGSVRLAVTTLGLTRVVTADARELVAFSHTEDFVPPSACDDVG
ncbi:MAG: hypothetical protein GX593_05865 [Actinomycetales bacterium]|nr:hypothetical protein [Actinomycetales bacterium]